MFGLLPSPNEFPLRWGLLLIASGLAAIKVGFFLPARVDLAVYHLFAPSLALLTQVGIVTLAVLYARSYPGAGRWADLLAASLLMVVIVLLVPAERRIESDESRMLVTSLSILHNGTALAPAAGIIDDQGVLSATEAMYDKRGVFFPTQLALLHSVLGYSTEHPFLLNIFAGVLALFAVGRLARRFLPTSVAPYAMVVFVGMPIFVIHTRTGTFDVMNFGFLALASHIALSVANAPTTLRLWLFAALAAAAAQLRYESVSLAGLVLCGAFLAMLTKPSWRLLCVPGTLWLPWTLVPAAWRQAVPFDHILPTAEAAAWSMTNFANNTEHLIVFIFNGGRSEMGNLAVGLVVLLLALRSPWVWRSANEGERTTTLRFMCWASFTLLPTMIVLCYFWGNANESFTVRYFLMFSLALVLIAVFSVQHLAGDLNKYRPWASRVAVAIFAVSAASLSIANSREGGRLNDLAFPYNTRTVIAQLRGTRFQCEGIIVAESGTPFVAAGFSTLSQPPHEPDIAVLDLRGLLFGPVQELTALAQNHLNGNCRRTISAVRFDPRVVMVK